MNFKKTVVLTLLILFVTYSVCLAVSNETIIGELPSNDINIHMNMDGSFRKLEYIISSTGATSGIRYKTSALTITVGGYKVTIDTMSLVNVKPSPGTTIYSQVIVTNEDIIKSIGEQHRAEVTSMLNNPGKYVDIGANIQIYNSGTGEVLATIKNKDDVSKIAGDIGFGSKDIEDMQSRFQVNTGTTTIVTIPEPDPNGDNESRGLRPAILVK